MPLALIETGHCNVDLKPSPIEPSWILEGNPEAHSHVLSTSACGAARQGFGASGCAAKTAC